MQNLALKHLADNYQVKLKKVNVTYLSFAKSLPKRCYDNSWKYIQQNIKSKYVLGFIVFYDIPIEHAWVKTNKYYDVTLKVDFNTYYSAIELNFTQLMELAMLCGYHPDLLAFNRYRNKMTTFS